MMTGLVALMTVAGLDSGKMVMFGVAGVFALITLAMVVSFWPRLWARRKNPVWLDQQHP